MDDADILTQVRDLVAEEHELRARRQSGDLSEDEEQERLRIVEESLDQCWDLLRQRRARREFGDDPDQAQARPVQEVEHYLQ
ncbi:MAG TPA: DUF2630 family protein [Mycobacteriales bacterium]|nr:DUF2630 family protein [Mycobacteriales bacterium]